MNFYTQAGYQNSRLFVDLIGTEIINEFLFELINFDNDISDRIINFSVKKLREYDIPVIQNDICVIAFSAQKADFNIQISQNLEKALKIFEMLNPEYFI